MKEQEKKYPSSVEIKNLRVLKIVFPIVVTTVVALFVPSAVPLIGMLMFGNLIKEIDKANAKKPPITIPIVVQFKNASVVIVAPTDNPKKIVAAFMILFEAASNKREVSLPIS